MKALVTRLCDQLDSVPSNHSEYLAAKALCAEAAKEIARLRALLRKVRWAVTQAGGMIPPDVLWEMRQALRTEVPPVTTSRLQQLPRKDSSDDPSASSR